ncbi:MAG: hypothetical protein QOI78_3484, partial [Actinomycetota bacterium]|nr:hypothetical protein [Actinomycetota bacterium]
AGTTRVAGRPAYQLTLMPRTAGSLVRSVQIAVDAATSVPLRVQIYPVGSSAPAWSTSFTDVTFGTPAAKIFAFKPPAGATVTDSAKKAPGEKAAESGQSDSSPTTVGDGWTSILALPPGSLDAAGLGDTNAKDDHGSMLDRVTTAVPEGRLLTTRLLSLVITPDGRVFIGAVPADAVRRAAAAS